MEVDSTTSGTTQHATASPITTPEKIKSALPPYFPFLSLARQILYKDNKISVETLATLSKIQLNQVNPYMELIEHIKIVEYNLEMSQNPSQKVGMQKKLLQLRETKEKMEMPPPKLLQLRQIANATLKQTVDENELLSTPVTPKLTIDITGMSPLNDTVTQDRIEGMDEDDRLQLLFDIETAKEKRELKERTDRAAIPTDTSTSAWIRASEQVRPISTGSGRAKNFRLGKMSCKHGRLRYTCKQCGGSGVCQHGRVRYTCKQCGGSGVCQHGRVRRICKDCGGSSLCEHGRQRYKCCGSGVCEHGRLRNVCKECGGSSLCEHGRERRLCKDCGGSSLCEHGRVRRLCKECGGSRCDTN